MKPCRNSGPDKSKLNPWRLKRATRAVENGGVIAYPTEAVMGLGCSPWNKAAVVRILRLKRRRPGKGLIVVASSPAQLSNLVDFSKAAAQEALWASWPGPFTWIVPARPDAPRWLRGRGAGLAVRVSAHPIVRQLCEAAGPLISTSANPSGCPPARTRPQARAYFGKRLDDYVPGPLGEETRPSQIRDALTGQTLRR